MNNLTKTGLLVSTLFFAVTLYASGKQDAKPESKPASAGETSESSSAGNTAAMQAGDQPNRPKSTRRSEEQIMAEECEGKSGKLLADCQTQVHLDYQSGNYN